MSALFHLTSSDPRVTDPVELDRGAPEWIDAVVPGGVHESLIAAGIIDHPYSADHEKDCRWVEDRAWWYRGTLPIPAGDDPLILTLTGVDTVADIWVNGHHVGRHASQYRPFQATLAPLDADEAEVLIRFAPPLDGLSEPPATRAMVNAVSEVLNAAAPKDMDAESSAGILSLNLAATRRRKGMFSWGWDFAPRVPSIGLTGSAELTRRSPVEVSYRVDTMSINDDCANVNVVVSTVHHSGPAPIDVTATLTSPDGDQVSGRARLRSGSAIVELQVDDPHLWWTHDLGEPSLYRVDVTVRDEDANIIASDSGMAGIRTITVDHSPDDPEDGQPARHFRFILNGLPIFARGANLVPQSMLVGSVTAQQDRDLVRACRDANMTMVRVWGGGIYASDAFMTACDEYGILVWHDFMYACIDYPGDDEAFMTEVRIEADYETRRLAHHPSLALWAGGNEVHAMHQAVWNSLAPGSWGTEIFDSILPQAVRRNSPTVDYWPNSPATDADTDPRVNGTRAGDRHAWEVWHGADVGAGTHENYSSPAEAMHFHRYRHDTGRFISEFGIHASADLPTLRRWLGADHLSLDDPVLVARNKDTPRAKGMALIEYEIGKPTSLQSYVTYSQVLQAEGLKFGIEHYRRRWPHCAGTLIWQLNEPWPGMTWSLLDHDLGAKPGYYAAARAFTPALAALRLTDDSLELWVSNARPTRVTDTVTVTIEGFDGTVDQTYHVEVTVPGSTSQLVWSVPRTDVPVDASHYVWVEGSDLPANRLFLTRIGDLTLPETSLDVTVDAIGPTTATVTVAATTFAYFVRVLTPWPGVRPDVSAFDLRPGTKAVVSVNGLPQGFNPAEITVHHFLDDVDR
ncbi:beta-mannosidase [Cutibacterium sp. WCA-380-WT-3A]|uniref:Beta-mannosidase B n=1 Tax=Cutibacterium porci TaxID=2605781 RepID=A0A7K0J6P2_9ACTN|nr:beta-mannosidase [Cutibacterium porci]MSS45617.1 beta-mannosidase [Cutibacterium porci]